MATLVEVIEAYRKLREVEPGDPTLAARQDFDALLGLPNPMNGMTVADLILTLRKAPPNLRVEFETVDGLIPVRSARTVEPNLVVLSWELRPR